MRMRRQRSESEMSTHGIDLAPMLDFCINLLIFFIITAVFIKQYGVVVNRPAAVQQQEQTKHKVIRVRIMDDGKISMSDRIVDVRAVRANIQRQLAESPKASVVVFAQTGAPTGVLVKVVDQAHLAGVSNVTFATQGPAAGS